MIGRAQPIDAKGERVPDSILHAAARSVAEWMTGRGEGVSSGPLRERQWLRCTAAGEVIVMPDCYRFEVVL